MEKNTTDNVEQKSTGEILKQARIDQGFSLDTVHNATKIPMDALRGIEEGYDLRILTPFYIKGFIKMYAKYLEVNLEDVVVECAPKNEHPKVADKEIMSDVDLQIWMSHIFTRKRKKQLFSIAGIFIGLFLIFKVITFSTHKKPSEKNSQVVVEKPDGVVLPVKETTNVKKAAVKKKISRASKRNKVVKEPIRVAAEVSIKKVTTKNALPSRTQVQKEIKPVTLTVRARKKGWITVKTDGTTVFRSSIGQGEVETWLADEQIEISGNIINQLEFDLNGKSIDPLGRKDRRAKRVIITKDGLKVSK